MNKDFDRWNGVKKEVNQKEIQKDTFFYEREVWWCSIGLNIGVEADGKSNNFERPILIIKKFNGQMVWAVPLTSKEKFGNHFFKVVHERGVSWVSLSQIKTVSTKRLLRKIGMISEEAFETVRSKISDYIKNSDPA